MIPSGISTTFGSSDFHNSVPWEKTANNFYSEEYYPKSPAYFTPKK